MKKILYFVPTFSNLSETFILREIETLDKRGNVNVHVVSLKEGSSPLPDALKSKVTYFHLSYVDIFEGLKFFTSNIKVVLKVAKKFFKESEDLPISKVKYLLKALLYAPKIQIFDFDQMHIHFLSDISTIISLVCCFIGKPFSISGHARDIFVDSSSINFKVKNSKFITVCNTKAYLKCIELSGGKGRKNLFMSFHGVDSAVYDFKERKFTPESTLKVLTDARFTLKKGLVPLSEAIVSLMSEYNFDIEFTIIGLAANEEQKTHLEEIKDIFKKSKYYNKLHIPGNGKGIVQSEVAEIYKNSDIFIYAGVDISSGDSDGVPNGLLQAAYSGLPVITTTAGSISDLFNDKNSYIINQNDSNDIIEKFNLMILDKKRLEKTENLRKDVHKNFDLDKNISYLESMFIK